jgi:hypothetical protein
MKMFVGSIAYQCTFVVTATFALLTVSPLLDAIRLDRKQQPYDLVWEDDQRLSGKVCNATYSSTELYISPHAWYSN